MPKQTYRLDVLLFCLCCQFGGCTWAEPGTPPFTASVASARASAQEGPRALLAAGKPTPFDVLTPYGRRDAIRQMAWRENVLVGFGKAAFIRELDHAQLANVLRFLDADNYLPLLEKDLIGPPLRLPAPSAQMEQDLLTLQQFAAEDDRRRADAAASMTALGAPAVLQRYQALFGKRLSPAALAGQKSGDLLILFDAAARAGNGNPDSRTVDDMLAVHHEFTARGIDTRRGLDASMLYAMLAARRFEGARAFAATRPHLANIAVPQVEDPLGPGFEGRSVFAYDALRNTLRRQALPAGSGAELVMVVGAGCHNSDNAMQAIHDDVALQARLQGVRLVLITAPAAPVETRLIAAWNAANPGIPMRAPYSAQEWQAIQVTGIPAFYLLKNGNVVRQHAGWPAEGKAALAGLIDAATK
jgi:hypothetical protein